MCGIHPIELRYLIIELLLIATANMVVLVILFALLIGGMLMGLDEIEKDG